MDCIYKLCFIVATLLIGVNSEIATFNMGGVTGNITFTWDGNGYTVVSTLIGLQDSYDWKIHSFPMFYNIKSPCSAVGDVLHGFKEEFGDFLSVNNQPYTASSTFNEEIFDRSIILSLSNSEERICAHIHRDTPNDVITAVANFQEPFAGSIMLRQDANDNRSTTTIFANLHDTVMPIEPAVYNWRVAEYSGEVDFSLSPEEICDQVMTSDPFNPTNADQLFCNKSDISTCAVGDLTGKFSTLTVEPIATLQRYFFNDPFLPLSGRDSIIQKILVLENENARSCAYIRRLDPKEVKTYIDSDNVQGSFTFRQNSPLDYTTVEIKLNNMQELAGGYHVHKFPVPQRFSAEDKICSDDSVSGHFNPYDVLKDDTYPAPATTTQDRYELGDLSGKYGFLTGFDKFVKTEMDWNLPLFGRNSIIGRSIVVHFSSDGSRWVCSTIGYPGEVKTVYGQFHTPVVGSIMFRQLADDPLSDTSVFIDVSYGDGSVATHNHNWHIHTTKVGGDMMADTNVCKSCEGHANPFNVYLDEYSNCKPEYPLRCETGDLSGKHGGITIADDMNTKAGKFFATDVQLALSGYGSIEAMSMVIHTADAGAPRLACTNIFTLEPKVISTGTWTTGPATGTMQFSQDSKYDLTKSHIDIQNLQMKAGGYHVHLLPVPMDMDSPCSSASVQGHFNPFRSATPKDGTDDMFQVGDISSKYGSFEGKDSIDETYHDSNLPLYGPQSIVGRSIVIHRNDSTGSRWMCSSLEQTLPTGAFQIDAKSMVNSKMYTGYIKMTQVHYWNGLLSDTTIELSLTPTDDYNDTDINWQIITNSGKCSDATRQTYNPYRIDTSKADYTEQCGLSSQVRCAVGDLTLKHGQFSTSLTRAVFNDVNLELSGRAAVIGHNLRLTDASNNEVHCGTLELSPSSGKRTSLTFPQRDKIFDFYNFRKTISDNVASVKLWQIVATSEPVAADVVDCIKVYFWILGDNYDEVINDIETAEYDVGLGKYSQTEICNAALRSVSSMLTIVILTLSSFVFSIIH